MALSGLSRVGKALLPAVLFGVVGTGELFSSSSLMAGGSLNYEAERGDSLTRVAARFGMDVPALAEMNNLKPTARLQLGQRLQIENPHLVPATLENGIIINIPQRMLFYFQSGKLAAAYPVAVGRRNWPTPEGNFEVLGKEKDKHWVVPLSIQQEMVRKGLPLRTKVPPGPDNPLGQYWIRISPSEGIHGTNAPASIYKFQTHGCIRLSPENIATLYEQVPIGTPVRIIYEPILLARLPDGNYYLEVHPDIYRKADNPLTTVQRMAATTGGDSMIDWQEVREAIRERRGLAENVSLPIASTP